MTIFLQSTIDKQVHIGHLLRKTLFHITILYFTICTALRFTKLHQTLQHII